MKSIWAHFGVNDFEVILVSMKAISIRIDSETLDKLHYVAGEQPGAHTHP